MGYFADIIKDSRLNLSARRGPVPPSQELDGQSSATVMAGAKFIPCRRPRNIVANRSPDAADKSLAPTAAAPIYSHAVSAQIVNAPKPKAKRLRRVDKAQNARLHSGPGDEHTDPGEPIEATDEQVTMSVIQRKALTTSASHPSAAGSPTVSGVRQPGIPSRGRLSVSQPSSNPVGASHWPPNAAASQSPRERPTRTAMPAGESRQATPGLSEQSIEPEAAMIEPEAPPTEQRTAPIAERFPAPTGQPHRPADTAVPIEATLRASVTKPEMLASSMASAPHDENATYAAASHDDTLRVQIGQVNVIVEESRVSPKSPPGGQRGDDLASRTFLRSL